jgi:BlaI family transcriptional regulator, penicillinase repressor
MTNFTDAELEVIQVLWEHGELSPQQIEERFPRSIKNATLRSVLMILLEKGHVRRKKAGRSYYYKAVTQKENAFRSLTDKMIQVFSGGSPVGLIAQLIESEELSDDDVRELQRIARLKAGKSR